MEKFIQASSSQAPSHGGETADVRNAIVYFGSFKLGKDGNLEPRTAASQTNNAASVAATSAAAPAAVEDAANSSNSKKIKNQRQVVEEASDKVIKNPEKKSVLGGNGSISGHNLFMNQEHEFLQNQLEEGLRKLQDFKDSNLNPTKPESLFNYQPITSENFFLEGSKSNPNPVYQDWDDHKFYDFANDTGIYSGVDYASTKMMMPADADRPLFNLSLLQEILVSGDYEEIFRLLIAFQGSYCDLMTDRALSLIFQRLINACRGNQLDFVIADLLSCSHLFINAAFSKIGASSIIGLMKKLKKSAHALSIVQIVSPHFFHMMTDETARYVILQCFIDFPNLHNKILYEKAILCCQSLATDRVGCRSLNDLIGMIFGDQRSRLLKNIADSSAYLSSHQYGNYVVQNLLTLKSDGISARIVLALRGQFVELGLTQVGSHVVEKCIDTSDFGIVSVVKEIVETPQASFNLARDQFGNYVIQTALKKAKERGLNEAFESLLKSLELYRKELGFSMSGKIVLGLMNEEVRSKWGRKEYYGNWKMVGKKERLVL